MPTHPAELAARIPRRHLARLALLAASAVWGTTFILVQKALEEIPVFPFLALRFALATLLLAPLAWRSPGWREAARDGVLLGSLLFAGFALQTSGLLWTTPSRSAFLTGLSVLLVPLLAWAAGGQKVRLGPVAGALVATLGLWLLFRPGAAQFSLGDSLTAGCALAFSGHTLAAERFVRRRALLPLSVVQFATVAALAAPSLLATPLTARQIQGTALFALLVTALLATVGGFLCQLYVQRHLSAPETAVILATEPVFAAALSLALGVEPWSWPLGLGGGLVVAGMLLTDLGGGARKLVAGAPHPRA